MLRPQAMQLVVVAVCAMVRPRTNVPQPPGGAKAALTRPAPAPHPQGRNGEADRSEAMVAARSGRDVMLRRALTGVLSPAGGAERLPLGGPVSGPAAPARRSPVMLAGLWAESQVACVGGSAVARRGGANRWRFCGERLGSLWVGGAVRGASEPRGVSWRCRRVPEGATAGVNGGAWRVNGEGADVNGEAARVNGWPWRPALCW